MSKENLSEIKAEVQKILDNHLEENQRFSIQDLDEESVFLLIDLLLEKDDKKKLGIRTIIEKNFKEHQKNIKIDFEKVLEIKDKLESIKNELNNLNDLKNIINSDLELNEQLNNI